MSTPDSSSAADAPRIAAARLALLQQLSHRAFTHKAQWPSQLFNELVIARIVAAQSGSEDPHLAAILANPSHTARAHAFPSPVLVYRDGDENSFSVADLTGLFFSTDASVRTGAAQESRRLFQFLGLLITNEVSEPLDSVVQLEETVWRVAAAQLRQLFDKEFLIVGFAYVHYERIGIDAFLQDRVKAACSDSPAVRAFVYSIHGKAPTTAIVSQEEQPPTAAPDWKIVDFLAGTEAQRLGGILNPPGSALDLVKTQFATSTDGTAPWETIASLVSLFKGEPDTRARPLADLEKMARHYIRVLECTFPGLSQASVVNAAWTMTNYLSTVNRLFPSQPNSTELFSSAGDLMHEYRTYWQYGKPVHSTSNTAYALTLSAVPPVTGEVLDALNDAVFDGPLPDQSLWPLITAFVAHMLIAVATSATTPEGLLFERVNEIAKKWIKVVPDQSMLAGLSEIQTKLSEPVTKEILTERYREFADRATVTNDASLALILTGAKRGQPSASDFVEIWQDAEWRTRLAKAELSVIQTAIGVCLGALEPYTTDVGVSFCHLLAEFALSTRSDAERFKQLASTVVVACVRTNTTSAVERLVSKCRGTEAVPLIQDAAEFLESHVPGAPPWIAGRMRAVLASVAR
jgi:hypothetical protein